MRYRAVLVVAPPSPARALLVATLQTKGYSVSVASEAEEALRLSHVERPDLLITGPSPALPEDWDVPIIRVAELTASAPPSAELIEGVLEEVERRAPPPLEA